VGVCVLPRILHFGVMLGVQKYSLCESVETDSNHAYDKMKYTSDELSSADSEVSEVSITLRIHNSAVGLFLHPKCDSKRLGKLNSSLTDWSTSYK